MDPEKAMAPASVMDPQGRAFDSLLGGKIAGEAKTPKPQKQSKIRPTRAQLIGGGKP